MPYKKKYMGYYFAIFIYKLSYQYKQVTIFKMTGTEYTVSLTHLVFS